MAAPAMTAAALQSLLLEHRLIAVLRLDASDDALAAARAVIAGGARLVEVTLTVPRALEVIATLASEAPPGVVIGAGTVLEPADLDRAIAAGARFAISPDVNPAVIRAAAERDIFHAPGIMTPSELTAALRAGARVVKVFPIASLGGANHVRALRGPFPLVPLLVTGGVDLDTVGDFLAVGASAVGLTTTLIRPEAVARGEWGAVTELARRWVDRLGRGGVPGSPPALAGPASQ